MTVRWTDGEGADARPVAPGFWVIGEPGVVAEVFHPYVAFGLGLVAQQIRAVRGADITVEILDLEFPHCDFQPEGLSAAMIQWAAEEFGITPPLVHIRFDAGINRYLFAFDESSSDLIADVP
jgi:hypothetical protein